MLNRNKLVFILAGILFAISSISAQNNARISADELIYNFGTIGESDGLASHIFTIKNTGNGPLVITRITGILRLYAARMDQRAHRSGKDRRSKSNLQPERTSRPFLQNYSDLQ